MSSMTISDGPSSSPLSTFWSLTKPFITGSLAGCASVTVVTPLDIVKVRVQVLAKEQQQMQQQKLSNQSNGKPNTISPIRVAKNIFKNEGVSGFYKGMSAIWTRQIVYKGSVLGSYDIILQKLSQSESQDGPPNPFHVLQAGLLAGGCSGLLATPFDIAIVRMQTDSMIQEKEKRRGYKNVVDALIKMKRQEGGKVLFRGASVTAMRAQSIAVGLQGSNTLIRDNLLMNEQWYEMLGRNMIVLMSAVLGGGICCLLSMPIDYTKTQIQQQIQRQKTGETVGSANHNRPFSSP